jgi:hypothetical protein
VTYLCLLLFPNLRPESLRSVKLAKWLSEKNIRFVLRIQKGRYIESGENFKRLSDLGLMPGTSFYLKDVQVTKQKGFGKFDIAGYWQRRYRGHEEDEGWYLLTNLGTLKEAVATFKFRSGIEATAVPAVMKYNSNN